jgi:integrase
MVRHTAATRLLELGLTWGQIEAITAHETREMAEHCVQQKRDTVIAISTLYRATARGK